MSDLKACPFCFEDFQLQVIRVDMKNPDRDIIKCRKCRGEGIRKYWQSRQTSNFIANSKDSKGSERNEPLKGKST